ncbi:MAG: AmmeMemoRadiSam system protein B [Chloroflexi bacterium]|nr:AmmeMemoRadiSam system protein B [Chloroflexota bacterium]
MSTRIDIRKSFIAGTWYPGTRDELARMVDDLLARVPTPSAQTEPLALIAPHAGYAYSGQTAAYAYKQLSNRDFDRVVILGPSHSEDFGAFAISAKKFYATPLGDVELDADFILELESKLRVTRVPNDREHSLEIQLPFLQRVLSSFKIIPIMLSRPFYIVGPDAYTHCQKLAFALAEMAKTRRFLIIASSDLAHLNDYATVKHNDAQFAELLRAYDIAKLVEYMWEENICRACGDTAIITALLAAKQLGAQRVEIFSRTNSGDVTGNRAAGQYTVGYLAAGVYKS